MKTTAGKGTRRVVLVPGATDAFAGDLARALRDGAENGVIVIDLDQIEQIYPAELRALEEALAAADAAGARLRVEGSRASVYKALQVAKLAGRFLGGQR